MLLQLYVFYQVNANSVSNIEKYITYDKMSNDFVPIPLDPTFKMMEYLLPRDFQSLMRSCKNNHRLCTLYIHQFLSNKFRYLLANNPSITVEHLMKIPFISTIKINLGMIPFYFGRQNKTNSIYIGLDVRTQNAFISFWIQKVQIKRASRFMTFVFNETGLHSIYMSQQFAYFSYALKSVKSASINFKKSDKNDIKAISELLLNEKISDILGDPTGTWCFKHRWDSFMFDADRCRCSLCKWIKLLMENAYFVYFLIIFSMLALFIGVVAYFVVAIW